MTFIQNFQKILNRTDSTTVYVSLQEENTSSNRTGVSDLKPQHSW